MSNIHNIITSDGVTLKKMTNNGEYAGACPWCGGKDRFRVWPETNNYWCRKCDRKGDAIQYLRDKHNMSFEEAAAQTGKQTNNKTAYTETRWELKDSEGNIVAVHVRQNGPNGKRYWWEIDGKPGLNKIPSVDLPLYGAELIGDCKDDVIIVEGEKCADTLRKLGYVALSTVTGASSCPSVNSLSILKGVSGSILLWPDNDAIGRKHMESVQESLKSLNLDSYIIRWPTAPEKGDCVDYVESGEDLGQLLDRTKRQNIDKGFVPVGNSVWEASDIDNLMLDGEVDWGIPTGFKKLDLIISGWQKGLFYILCARSGMGKTSLALNFARLAAINNYSVAIFSLETSKVRLTSRMAWQQARINRSQVEANVRVNKYDPEMKSNIASRITEAYSVVYNLPIYVDDKTGLTTEDLRKRLDNLLAKKQVDMVIVDHLGKLRDKGKTILERTSIVSKRLADMTIEYDVPIMSLCQLNRGTENKDRKDPRPQLYDLKNSGDIEDDARVVLGLYRDSYYQEFPKLPDLSQLRVLKNNEGEAGQTVPLYCDKPTREWLPWPDSMSQALKVYNDEKGWLKK